MFPLSFPLLPHSPPSFHILSPHCASFSGSRKDFTPLTWVCFFSLTVVSYQGELSYNNAVARTIIRIQTDNWTPIFFSVLRTLYIQIFLKVLTFFPPSIHSHSTTPWPLTASPEVCSVLALLLGSYSQQAPHIGTQLVPQIPWIL